MKAVHLTKLGSVENLKIVDVPKPELSENEVLIKTKAFGIMFADTQQRRGDYIIQPPLPFIPGKEASGIVEKVGSNVKNIKPGMRVVTVVLIGAYAEYVKNDEKDVYVLPDKVSFQQGLVYIANFPVAYIMYKYFGRVQIGDTILIHAAAGGVGALITQIAKRKDQTTVIALSSSDEKLEYCKKNGADHCVNYKTTDYTEEVLKLTDGQGVDVCFNSISGPTLQTDPHCIKTEGRWLIYGFAGGHSTLCPTDLELLQKALTIVPVSSYVVMAQEDEFYKVMQAMENWLATETLDSPTSVFSLENIGAAHTLLESQKSSGKIVVEM